MFAIVLLPAVLAGQADPKVPAALVVGLQGPAAVERSGSKSAAAEGGLLLPGDKVTAGEKGGLTVVLLSDGRRLRLKPGKSAAVGEKGFDPAEAGEEVDGPRPDPALLRTLRDAYRGRPSGGGATTVLRGPGDEREAARARIRAYSAATGSLCSSI